MLSSTSFLEEADFESFPRGRLFRFAGLPAGLVCLKVEGEDEQDWILLLGTVTTGAYPAPWYGRMDDIDKRSLRTTSRDIAVHPLLPPVSPRSVRVCPGDLLADARGAFSIYIEDRLAIALSDGSRRNINIHQMTVHKAWSIHYREDAPSKAFFFLPTPGAVERAPGD